MKYSCFRLIISLLAFTLSTTAQTNASATLSTGADSLFKELKKWQGKTGIAADTNLYNTYLSLGNNFQDSNPDTALYFYTKSIVYAKKQHDELKESISIINQGSCFFFKSDYDQAIKHYHQALTIAEKNSKFPTKKEKAKKIQVTALGGIGIVFHSQGDYSNALDYYFKSLKINEEIGNKQSQAANLGNIGIVYANQGDYSKALDYYFKALKMNEETGNKQGQAIKLGNIGTVYFEQGDPLVTSSKEESFRIGYSKALDYFFKALKMNEEIGNINVQADNLCNIGAVYLKQKKYKESETYLNRGIQLGEELGFSYNLQVFYNALSELYTQTGKHQEALEAYKKHIMYRDSVMSEENQKAAVQKEMQFEFDKKEAIAKAEQEKKDALAKEELERQTMQRNGFIGGFILMLALAGVVFRSYRNKQQANVIITKQKHEVEQQKHIIEEKHKEITDSINYAERIQRSFLATSEMLDNYLGVTSSSPKHEGVSRSERNYFVFFRPKDVVSGDFYWAAELNNGNFAFSVADSTGHGVPGAIMSILNISSLEKSIETQTEPHHILSETRKIIINRLKKDGSPEGGKDGMDCSLLVLNQNKTQLSFASAHNPVFIVRSTIIASEERTKQSVPKNEIASLPTVVRNNDAVVTSSADEGSVTRSNSMQLLEFKGDKMPVGKHEKEKEPFTLHTITLQKGDVIYALTDGFPDQFGGDKGKKYMIKNLKELLLQIAHLPMLEQEQKLAEEFDKWKGSNEQVDDVCVIGVRI